MYSGQKFRENRGEMLQRSDISKIYGGRPGMACRRVLGGSIMENPNPSRLRNHFDIAALPRYVRGQIQADTYTLLCRVPCFLTVETRKMAA